MTTEEWPRPLDGMTPSERARVAREQFRRPDPSVFQGALPAAVFIAVNWAGPTQLAIVASFATAAVVFARNPGRGVIRLLTLLSFSIVALSAVIGIVSDSGKAFAAQNMVGDFAIALVCAGSMVVGRPLIGAVAHELVPAMKPVMAINHPAFVWLTALNGVMNAGQGVARWFMLDAMEVNTYVVVSRVVFIPMTVAFVVLCYAIVNRVAVRIWPADVVGGEG